MTNEKSYAIIRMDIRITYKEAVIMETICVTLSQEEKDKLFEILDENNMTFDQVVEGFFRWLIRDTDAALKWLGIDKHKVIN